MKRFNNLKLFRDINAERRRNERQRVTGAMRREPAPAQMSQIDLLIWGLGKLDLGLPIKALGLIRISLHRSLWREIGAGSTRSHHASRGETSYCTSQGTYVPRRYPHRLPPRASALGPRCCGSCACGYPSRFYAPAMVDAMVRLTVAATIPPTARRRASGFGDGLAHDAPSDHVATVALTVAATVPATVPRTIATTTEPTISETVWPGRWRRWWGSVRDGRPDHPKSGFC